MEGFGRTYGRVLEIGPFSGGISFELASRYPALEFTLADDNGSYLDVLNEEIGKRGLKTRFEIVDASMDNLPFGDDSFDLVILRGAFFFLVDKPNILSEINRILAPGGFAFIGGGYGKGIPNSVIEGIAEESRVLNDRLGRRRIEISQLRDMLKANGLEKDSSIIEEGGVWIQIRPRVNLAPAKIVSGLVEAFDLRPSEIVSLVGGGGKTTLMFQLAGELLKSGKTVITTTTTRIMEPSSVESACLLVEEDEERLFGRLKEEMGKHRHVTAARLRPGDGKLKGLLPETVDKLADLKLADYIINEADGAGRKPIKAPNATEPVIPSSTTLVVAVVGMDALNSKLSSEVAFRSELITRLTGLPEGGIISSEVMATLITAKEGIAQYTPAPTRIIPFINKTELAAGGAGVQDLATAILSRCNSSITRVVAGSLKTSKSACQVIAPASIT
jgi:probable selenium-dependent hydroxylase accessory protein YqeC